MKKINKQAGLYFIIGLVVGISISMLFNYRSRIFDLEIPFNFISTSNDSLSILPSDQIDSNSTFETNSNNSARNKYQSKVNTNEMTADSLQIDSVYANFGVYADEDSLIGNGKITIDTLVLTSFGANKRVNNQHVKIAKNELIYSMYVIPQGAQSDFLCRTVNATDSLINNLQKESSKSENGLYVEFWRSPINTIGYQLTSNTLILFGFYEYQAVKLKYLPNGLIRLQYLENSFDIGCNDDFTSLVLKKKNR